MSKSRSLACLLAAACGTTLALAPVTTFAQATPSTGTDVAPNKKENAEPTKVEDKDVDMGIASAIEMVTAVNATKLPLTEWQTAGQACAPDVPATRTFTKSGDTALLLGVKVSDAIIASYAKDNQTVARTAPVVMKMAQTIGAKQEDLDEATKLSEELLKGNVLGVVFKLNELAIMVQIRLEEGTEEEKGLGNLMAIAAYFQGLRTTATALSTEANYTAERSKVFRQANTLKGISKRIESLPADLKKLPTVVLITEQITALNDIMTGKKDKDATFTRDEVLKIKAATDKIVTAIK
ncbi:hypothetical protein DB346_12195 [Verrucomicrobia bacterium LW23]|nr:hypothetical protein DB346_12195 [Verrucomicrobia bacterium LW23]